MTDLLNEIYETTISLRKPGPENEAREARQNEWIAAGGTLYRMASILKNPGREMLQKVLFDREVITHVIQDIKIRNLWLSGATGKERNRNTKQTNKTLPKTITEDQFMDIIFLVWLDGVHDEYVKQTFRQWTNGGFFKKYFGGKHELTGAVNKIVNKFFVQGQEGTDFMKALFNSMKSKLQHQKRFMQNTLSNDENVAFAPIGSAWESLIKWDIGTIFNYPPPRKLKRNQFLSKGTKPTNTKVPVLYVSVDAEERDDKPLSRLVDNSRKVMNNLVTPGTLLDPGNTMILEGINTDIGQMVEHHFGSGGSFNLRNSYYIAPMTLDMKLEGGQSVFKLELKVNNGIAKSSDNKHSVGSFFTQKLNGESIPNMASAKIVAQKGKGGDQVNAAASKWSGDGLQYIYQAFIGAVNPNPGAVRYPFGSQDGMADCCFCKWSELLGETKPIVFVDWGLATGKSGSMVIQAYNLPETLKTRQLVASEISLRGPETIQGTPILFTPVAPVADKNKNLTMTRLKAAYGNNANMNAEIDSIFSAGDFLAPLSMDYKKILHRLRTLDGESFANNVGKNEYIRKIFDEFKSKFYDYIFVDNNELMDKINSKITNLTNMVTKGKKYVETNLNRATFQNYSSLINRISKKLIMNGAKRDQVVMMADRAKKFKLSDSNKKQILNLLKTTTNTPGVINVLKQINKMNKKTDGGTGSQGTARTPSGQLISTPGNGLKANATSAKREAPAPVPAKIRAKMLSARVNAQAEAKRQANAQRERKRQKIGNQ